MATKGVVNKSLSYYILLSLEKAVDGFVRIEDLGYHGTAYIYDRPLKKARLAQALKRLRERGLIEQDKINLGEVILKLTNSGKEAIQMDHLVQSDWDGKWRIVIWDIPEQKRIIRNLFRRNLKKWGFRNLQKSVWVSQRPVYQQLIDYIKYLKIEEWVVVLETDKISKFQ